MSRPTRKVKRDERWALKAIAVLVGNLMHEAQQKSAVPVATILACGVEVQTVLLQIDQR